VEEGIARNVGRVRRVVLENSDDDGIWGGCRRGLRGGGGGGLLALQREAGAAGMELSVRRSVSSTVGGYNWKLSLNVTPPRNVASNGSDDHADRREKAVRL